MADKVWPVAIVGAGPQALSLVSYLKCQGNSSASMTDEEHSRYIKHCGKTGQDAWGRFVDESTVVIDPAGSWLHQWNDQFAALKISHLRSPMAAHPDMSQDSALLEYLQLHHSSTLSKVSGEAIQGLSAGTRSARRRQHRRRGKSAMRYRNGDADPFESSVLYTRPEVPAFNEFLSQVVTNTSGPTVMAAYVLDVERDENGIYIVRLSNNETVRCRRVVLAVGNGQPRLPAWAKPLMTTTPPASPDLSARHTKPQPLILHTHSLGQLTKRDIAHRRVLVVGGGMSAAHACLLALNKHPAELQLWSRHPLREQEFDASIDWFSRYSSAAERCAFYQADIEARKEMIAQARGGPSISSDVLKRLRCQIEAKRMELCLGELKDVQQGDDDWLATGHKMADGKGVDVEVRADVIILATGFNATVEGHPLLRQLSQRYNLQDHQGLPVLSNGLEWHAGLHVMGSLAALGIGPDAGNLSGGRRAAATIGEVIVGEMEAEYESRVVRPAAKQARKKGKAAKHRAGLGNMFSVLDVA
eukprot:TRINITY_DN8313_c0_g1_i1.p1 TRINITY_DN8313_c0_g1~~TRINITY_DN8313_c0_g1_i1.p1  ORF type:complete len:529 (+),score=97.67 TRINITY_DN8313_c0_g1_i1:38-1624(+)